MNAASPRLRLGVIGLGRAFTLMAPAFKADPRVEVCAGADLRPEARAQFERDFRAQAFEDAHALCASSEVDAVYVASPHPQHEQHVLLAARYGKHVMVEKPMAISLEACNRMIEACAQAGVTLMVGHSHSFDAPVGTCLDLIRQRDFGVVRMLAAFNYTDFMFRPRRADELDVRSGGGAVFNQAAHHVDIARLLCGGPVEQVDAFIGNWDTRRDSHGAYSAILRFANGACANLTYSGYAHFNTDQWMDGVGELGRLVAPDKHARTRQRLHAAVDQASEDALRTGRAYGADGWAGDSAGADGHQHFGPLIVSCERADLRPSALGVHIHADDGYSFVPLAAPLVERQQVVDAFVGSIAQGRAPKQDGYWGRATLAVCLAIINAAGQQRGVKPEYQMVPGELA